MTRLLALLAVLALAACASVGLVLYAQTLPRPATVTWNPNAAADNVVDYQVTLDAGAPLTLPAASCTATACSQAISIPTLGAHTVSVLARNLALSTDPTSLQASAPTTVSFTLNRAPSGATNVTVR